MLGNIVVELVKSVETKVISLIVENDVIFVEKDMLVVLSAIEEKISSSISRDKGKIIQIVVWIKIIVLLHLILNLGHLVRIKRLKMKKLICTKEMKHDYKKEVLLINRSEEVFLQVEELIVLNDEEELIVPLIQVEDLVEVQEKREDFFIRTEDVEVWIIDQVDSLNKKAKSEKEKIILVISKEHLIYILMNQKDAIEENNLHNWGEESY